MLLRAQTLGRPPLQRLLIISRRVHVFQNQPVLIDRAPLSSINKIHAKLLNGVGNFSHTPLERGGNRRGTLMPINRGQRLDPARGSWNDGFTARTQGARKQPVEPFFRKIRQVAGDDQIPSRARFSQSGGDSCERSRPKTICPELSLRIVSNSAQSELPISDRRSDDCDFTDERFEQSGGVKDQRDAVEIEKPLVAAHARTGAPRENEAGDLTMARHDCPPILRLRSQLAQGHGGF